MSRSIRFCSVMAVLSVANVACVGKLINSPGFTHQGVEVKCLEDIPQEYETVVRDASKLGIDVLQDETFKKRALAALNDSETHTSCKDESVASLTAEQKTSLILQRANENGFSLSTRNSFSPWSITNGWEGFDDPRGKCGRIIQLNRRKLGRLDSYIWAGTVVHEMTHVAGFGHHMVSKRPGNECTIPHVLGDLAEWTAWELQQARNGSKDPYETHQTVCASVAKLCRQSDEQHRCIVNAQAGEVRGQMPLCELRAH